VSRDVVRVVPGGVDTRRFVPARNRDALRRGLGFSDAGPVLFTLRNLEPRMGLEELVAAMPAIVARHPHACLVIGGHGPLEERLRAAARAHGVAEAVAFAGFIAEELLPAYYAAADLFVLPSLALEGFGLVTVEALACGTPVLGSRVGATPELLAPLDAGLLLDDVTPAAIATGVERLLARGDRADLARRCRVHAERYAWDAAVETLERELAILTSTGAEAVVS
jgi:glycosyltransferase involved in cell wall biosynthesis